MPNLAVETKQDILRLIRTHQSRISQLGVKKLGLFGSYARNEQSRESDVDLLVEFAPGRKSFDNFMQLSFLLEEALQKPVELVTPESLSPYLRPHIMAEVEYVTITP